MQASRSVKTFNLATNLCEYSEEASEGLYQRLRLQTNLFDQEVPERIKHIRFEEQRAYDYVGVKELKAYYDRARRVSKDKRKDTLTISLALSRHSLVSRQDDDLFNKWQILERVENTLDKHPSNPSAISKLDLTARDNHKSKNTAARPQLRQTDTSSIVKMRNNFRIYREGWERDEQRAELTKGFPSVLRLATESRSVSLKKALDEQSFKKENIPPRMWSTVLREKRELKNIYDSPAYFPAKAERLTLSGKNKLALEKEWLSRKGDDGYRFQLLKKEKHPA